MGDVPVNTIDVYDLTTGSWSVEHLSLAGHSIAAATVGDKLFLAGGNGLGNGRERQLDIYNSSTNSWSTTTLPASFYEGHSAITVGSKVYIAGGQGPGDHPIIEIYDNSSNTWATSTMNINQIFFGTVNVGNKIYWGPGIMGLTPGCLMEVWDVPTGTSSSMFTGIQDMYYINYGLNTVVQNGKIIFPSQNYFNMYDVQTNTWSTGSFFPSTQYCTSIISVNDTIYITSASDNNAHSEKVYKLVF